MHTKSKTQDKTEVSNVPKRIEPRTGTHKERYKKDQSWCMSVFDPMISFTSNILISFLLQKTKHLFHYFPCRCKNRASVAKFSHLKLR
jgi:hypothetical protein